MKNTKLIAILRGINPEEAVDIAKKVAAAGFCKIEVPLNSPNALQSINLMVKALTNKANSDNNTDNTELEIGAGTVLTVEQVEQVAKAGASFIVSPNCDEKIIVSSKKYKLKSYPGVFSASECFKAIAAGADGLKFFPAMQMGADAFYTLKSVLPNNIDYFAVGGIGADEIKTWLNVGIDGFGFGSSLYKPGQSAAVVFAQAKILMTAFDEAKSQLISNKKL